MIKTSKKAEKAIEKLKALKQKLEGRLVRTEKASEEVKNISIQLDNLEKNLPK